MACCSRRTTSADAPPQGRYFTAKGGCRTTDVGGPRQDRPSGAEADRSGV